jgi:hypothetical protein
MDKYAYDIYPWHAKSWRAASQTGWAGQHQPEQKKKKGIIIYAHNLVHSLEREELINREKQKEKKQFYIFKRFAQLQQLKYILKSKSNKIWI